MAVTLEVSYFNTFWLKRLKNINQYQERLPDGTVDASGGGITTGTPDVVTGDGYVNSNVYEDWFVEEARIKGGFNNTSVDFGNKAYIVEEEANQTRRQSSIIYSGVYNAKNGINNTNQFPIGEEITRSVDPASGSIQKLYAENTNLLILQERKVNRAPVDKDVIFTQEGLPLTTDAQQVIGTPSAFEGNFGISRDPGSFAVYGYNKYFTDRDRSVVMQLGANGLTEISNYGMIDYFRDKLNGPGEIIGGYDVYQKNYVLTINSQTLVFDNLVNGWVSFMDYFPDMSTSLKGNYYTFKNNGVWKHYSTLTNPGTYNKFYGQNVRSEVTLVFNPNPTMTKTFHTLNYVGSNGWEADNPLSGFIAEGGRSEITGVDRNPQQPGLGLTTHIDRINKIKSYDEGYYVDPTTNVQYRAGFDRKQNVYYAAIKNNSNTLAGEVVTPGNLVSGIKAQYVEVVITQDDSTDVNGPKQLFSVGSVYSNR